MSKKLFIMLICIFATIFIFSTTTLLEYCKDTHNQEIKHQELLNKIETSVPTIKDEAYEPIYENGILKQYYNLYQENNDLVGWIKIENTKLNYPVMLNKTNSEYYLRRNFDGDWSLYGTPFLQAGTIINEDNESDNIVIYGHNMDDGTEFHTLEYYKNKDYYLDHPIIKFDTLIEEREYEIVAVFKTTVYKEDCFKYYKYQNLSDKEIFNEYKKHVEELKLYDTKSDLEYGDKLITLSTCSYHDKNGRLVVIAKKLEKKPIKVIKKLQ